VHPGAWWAWALGLATAASTTTNPLLLALLLAVVCLVVAARRGASPWARAFRLYLWLGLAIVVVRVVLHVLVGLKFGTVVLLPVPAATMPSWAAGIQLGGTVYLEGLLGAVVLALRLAVLIACIGAANALANPKRLLRAFPAALAEIGTAVVISVTAAPQLAESVQRVLRARRLRGDNAKGLRSVRQVALPVLQDTLDRSLLLASAMDSRGYGHRVEQSPAARRVTAALTLGGLLGACLGLYGLLDTTSPVWLGVPVLLLGLVLAVAGLWLGGRAVRRTSYRPDPWALPEWTTTTAGAVAAGCLLVQARLDPLAMTLPLEPLTAPLLPLLAVAGILVGAAPALLTPPPPRSPARGATAARRTPTLATGRAS
jgi:energy-coupling factor transport system permease protein